MLAGRAERARLAAIVDHEQAATAQQVVGSWGREKVMNMHWSIWLPTLVALAAMVGFVSSLAV